MKILNTQVQKQEQAQIMSQKQLQSLKVLSMSRQDLEKMVEEEIEVNPLLEMNHSFSYEKNNIDFDLLLNYVEEKRNLEEVLLEQLHLYPQDIDVEIGEFIIHCLDNNGYLLYSTHEIEQILKVGKEKIENMIQIIQTFEPIGCASHSLNECIIAQLIHSHDTYATLAIEICKNYLQQLADNKINDIINGTHASKEEIRDAINLIKKMNPRPGSEYYNEPLYISCDMEIVKDNSEIIIKDLFENYDLKIVDIYDQVDDNLVNQYVSKQKNKARTFIQSLDKRRKTLFELTTFLVEYHKDFFINGSTIKSLTMQQVADSLSLSESTISRAVKDKYLLFENTVYSYKYFFTQKLESGECSDEIIMRIKYYVDHENKKRPLSDQQICNFLNDEGIKIARRTISKYREKANIRSALKRKEI